MTPGSSPSRKTRACYPCVLLPCHLLVSIPGPNSETLVGGDLLGGPFLLSLCLRFSGCCHLLQFMAPLHAQGTVLRASRGPRELPPCPPWFLLGLGGGTRSLVSLNEFSQMPMTSSRWLCSPVEVRTELIVRAMSLSGTRAQLLRIRVDPCPSLCLYNPFPPSYVSPHCAGAPPYCLDSKSSHQCTPLPTSGPRVYIMFQNGPLPLFAHRFHKSELNP